LLTFLPVKAVLHYSNVPMVVNSVNTYLLTTDSFCLYRKIEEIRTSIDHQIDLVISDSCHTILSMLMPEFI
jgi:hypothetical protein